jgi:hypothetical protein
MAHPFSQRSHAGTSVQDRCVQINPIARHVGALGDIVIAHGRRIFVRTAPPTSLDAFRASEDEQLAGMNGRSSRIISGIGLSSSQYGRRGCDRGSTVFVPTAGEDVAGTQ